MESDLSSSGEGEKVASLFQPDTLLSEQYFETLRRKTYLEPEKKLMLAVLEDAVACFQKYVSAQRAREKAIFQEAEEWILEENSDWPFSFESICEILGLNPEYLRDGLLQWKEVKLRERPKAKIHHLNPGQKRGGFRAAMSEPKGDGERELKFGTM